MRCCCTSRHKQLVRTPGVKRIVGDFALMSRALGIPHPAPFNLYAISAFVDSVQAEGIGILELNESLWRIAMMSEKSALLLTFGTRGWFG